MKTKAIAFAAGLLAASALPAAAPSKSEAASPAPAAAAAKLSSESDIGALLDNPGAKSVLEKYVPQLISNPQIAMARSMSLKQLQQYAGDALTDEVMGKIDTDLAKLPAK